MKDPALGWSQPHIWLGNVDNNAIWAKSPLIQSFNVSAWKSDDKLDTFTDSN